MLASIFLDTPINRYYFNKNQAGINLFIYNLSNLMALSVHTTP